MFSILFFNECENNVIVVDFFSWNVPKDEVLTDLLCNNTNKI